jgi:hypothetical protein
LSFKDIELVERTAPCTKKNKHLVKKPAQQEQEKALKEAKEAATRIPALTYGYFSENRFYKVPWRIYFDVPQREKYVNLTSHFTDCIGYNHDKTLMASISSVRDEIIQSCKQYSYSGYRVLEVWDLATGLRISYYNMHDNYDYYTDYTSITFSDNNSELSIHTSDYIAWCRFRLIDTQEPTLQEVLALMLSWKGIYPEHLQKDLKNIYAKNDIASQSDYLKQHNQVPASLYFKYCCTLGICTLFFWFYNTYM